MGGAVLVGVVLLAGAGCNCISINVGAPAAYAPGMAPGGPPPSGGNFVPVQTSIATYSGTTTICNPPQQISDKYARFYPPSQTPNPGENGFRGYLYNVTANAVIPNSTYVLQWIVDLNNRGCATPVANSTTDVSFPATAGLYYKIAAHFKPGQIPAGNPTIRLNGAWIIQ